MSEENQNQEEQGQEVILTEAEQQAQHDQAMIDKVDANNAKTEGELQTDQEKMLAGKYKTVEELEKAYEHLQTKLGQPEETEAEPENNEVPEEASKSEAEKLTADAGIDYSALESEYAENGELSQETREALNKAGISNEMTDAYIAGQEALAQQTVIKMQNIAGGEQEYSEMVQWAQDTLSESELTAFNASLTDEASMEFAIQGLHARYTAAQGPNLIKGSNAKVTSGGFNSKAEMMREMANPQYARDPAFRAEVQRRVALSNF